MDTRNRTTSLDVAKCLAAFLVVAIHADFPGMFGKYVNAWARIAGPLFFIISGYYYPILASQGKQNSHVPFHRLDAAQGPLSIHIPAKPLRVLLCLGQCRLRKQKHGRCYRAAILFLYLYVPSPCHKPVLKHSMAVPKQTLRFYPAHRGLHSHDSLHNTNPGPLLRNPKKQGSAPFPETAMLSLKKLLKERD